MTWKSVLCATQMLEIMIRKPHRTHAEGSGVANAVLEGADCIMLSREIPKEDYLLQAACLYHMIVQEAEAAMFHLLLFEEFVQASS